MKLLAVCERRKNEKGERRRRKGKGERRKERRKGKGERTKNEMNREGKGIGERRRRKAKMIVTHGTGKEKEKNGRRWKGEGTYEIILIQLITREAHSSIWALDKGQKRKHTKILRGLCQATELGPASSRDLVQHFYEVCA
jgi:hypothetical protein